MADKRDNVGKGGLLVYATASSECDGAHNKTLDFGELFNTIRVTLNGTATAGVSILPSTAAGPVAASTPGASGTVVANPAFFIAPGHPSVEIRLKDRFQYLGVKVFSAADVSLLVEACNT